MSSSKDTTTSKRIMKLERFLPEEKPGRIEQPFFYILIALASSWCLLHNLDGHFNVPYS